MNSQMGFIKILLFLNLVWAYTAKNLCIMGNWFWVFLYLVWINFRSIYQWSWCDWEWT